MTGFDKLIGILFDTMHIVLYCTFLLYAVVAYVSLRRKEPRVGSGMARPVQWLILIAAVVVPPLAITVFGRYHLAGFDHSLLIDLGYRQMQGQAPYGDFINTTPAYFSLGAHFAMQWFGMKWMAFVYICALAALGASIWLTWLLVRVTGGLVAGSLCAATAVTMTMVVASFWWYNQITALAGIIFLASCWDLVSERAGKWSWVSYTLSLTVLAGMKPNVAGLLIAGSVVIVWFTRPKMRLTLASLTAVAFVLFNIILAVGVHTNLLELLRSYGNASERGLTELNGFGDFWWPTRFVFIPIGVIALLPLAVILIQKVNLDQVRPQYYLCLLGCAVGIYAMFANMESKMNDFVFLVFSAFLLVRAVAVHAPEAARTALRLAGASLLMFAVYSGISGWQRERVESAGPGRFHEHGPTITMETGFFAGSRMSPGLVAVVKQTEELVAKAPGKTYYFGPRMEFLYCVTQLPSPRRLPLWWHPGSSYPQKKEAEILGEWSSQKFDTLIYLKNNFTYHSPARKKLLTDSYDQDDSLSLLTVMTRKK